jgi:hypothetical protein
MWAHYANNYKGFVIEFDEKHQFFNNPTLPEDNLGRLKKVEYSDMRPSHRTLTEMTVQEIFLLKSKEWEYEQEWRMVVNLGEPEALSLNLNKDGKRMFDTDGIPIYLCPIPPLSITGVIFGSRMTDANKKAISKLLKSDIRYAHVRKYQSILDDKTFKLHTELSEV